MKYMKILFLVFAAAMLMACGGDPGSTGNNTSGYTTTDSNAHVAQWVTIDIKIATGGVDASDAKVFVQRSYDDTPVLHGTVADLDKDPVKVDIADPEQLWVQITLEKPGFMIGDPPWSGKLKQDIETLRTNGEKSITMNFPLAVDLTTSDWTCTTTKYLNGQPNGTESYTGPIEMGLGAQTDTYFGCVYDQSQKGFGVLGYTITKNSDQDYPKKGEIAQDGKSLDYDALHNDGSLASKNHCTR